MNDNSDGKPAGKGRRILGITFFNGGCLEAIQNLECGGLLTAPSGPGLASDLFRCNEYRKALEQSDLVLADSGFLCLWERIFGQTKLERISGLNFLQVFLENSNWKAESSFWVMPDEKQSRKNTSWIEENFKIKIPNHSIYVPPKYNKEGVLCDPELLAKIEEYKPKNIFIQIGGGPQERLGLFLKTCLSYKPRILCTGAALAFLSGNQVKIPKFFDRFYLGWLLRCLASPHIFIPRYLRALRLIFILFKYRKSYSSN